MGLCWPPTTASSASRRAITPTGNAVIERFIRTMKEEVIWLRHWDSAAELREALTVWLAKYRTRRAHRFLGWLTPSEYRAAHLSKPAALAA